MPRCMYSPDWKFECSPRFEALLSAKVGPFWLPLSPPCPPSSTAPGDGLHGGLLEGSCGRRRYRGMLNCHNVCKSAYLFQNKKRFNLKVVPQNNCC